MSCFNNPNINTRVY